MPAVGKRVGASLRIGNRQPVSDRRLDELEAGLRCSLKVPCIRGVAPEALGECLQMSIYSTPSVLVA